jgi:hypothetical protein
LHGRAGQIEIILNFFVGYYLNGCYIHSVPEIAKRSDYYFGEFEVDFAALVAAMAASNFAFLLSLI